MSSATITARFTWQRDGGIGHPGPLDPVVPTGRALLRPIALDERRGPGRTRGEGADRAATSRPRRRARRPRPEARGARAGAMLAPVRLPGPARHGVQSSSCAAQAERSPWRGEPPRLRPIAARLARSLHRAARDPARAEPLAPAHRAAAGQPPRSPPAAPAQLGGAQAPRAARRGRRRGPDAPAARGHPVVVARRLLHHGQRQPLPRVHRPLRPRLRREHEPAGAAGRDPEPPRRRVPVPGRARRRRGPSPEAARHVDRRRLRARRAARPRARAVDDARSRRPRSG